MATPVPYNTQFVPAELRPTPPEQISTPLGAFGGYTGEALGHLGQVQEGAGNELFARAVAMQQLDQQSKALQATADFTTQLGQRFEQYRTLAGQAAVQGYQPFIEDVNSMREQMKGNLQSPFAQLQFDQDTRRIQSYIAMSAASHAGDQAKQYNIGAEQARAQSAADIAASTTNYDAFHSSIGTIRGAYQQLGTIQGWSPERLEFETQSAISKSTLSYVNSLAKRSPYTAQQFLEKAHKDGLISGADYSNAQDSVQRQQYTVETRNIGSKAMGGIGGGDGIVTAEQARAGIKAVEGGNYGITNSKTGALGAYQVLPSNLGPWLREAGMPQMSPQQFLNDKAAQDQLFDFKFGQYMQKNGSFNKAVSQWFTGDPNASLDRSDGNITLAQYQQTANAAIAHASLPTAIANGRAMAEAERPGDLTFGDLVEQHVRTLYYKNERDQKDAEDNNKMTVMSAIDTPQQGKLPTDWKTVISNPQVKTAFDSMNAPDQQKMYDYFLGNITGKRAISVEDMAEYKRLRGIYLDPNATPDERTELLNSDIVNMQLPASMISQLMSMRKNIYNNSTAEPDMALALKVMSPTMNSAGIVKEPGDTQKSGDYWTYLTDLKSAMEEYEQVYKAKPRPADIKEMGNMLIEQHKGWFGVSSAPVTVPAKDRATIIKAYQSDQHRDPYESEIRDAYVKHQFSLYYQKKLKNAGQ